MFCASVWWSERHCINTGVTGKFLSVQHLGVAVQGSVMQGSASTAVWDVDAAEQGDDDLGTSQRVVGRGNMQWGLPVLVPCVDVGGVVDQDSHHFLKHSVKDRVISLVFVYWKTARDQLIDITWDSGRLMSNVLITAYLFQWARVTTWPACNCHHNQNQKREFMNHIIYNNHSKSTRKQLVKVDWSTAACLWVSLHFSDVFLMATVPKVLDTTSKTCKKLYIILNLGTLPAANSSHACTEG